MRPVPIYFLLFTFLISLGSTAIAERTHAEVIAEIRESKIEGFILPRPLSSYQDGQMDTPLAVLQNRISKEPFNLIATLLFAGAIIHTFMTAKLRSLGTYYDKKYEEKIERRKREGLMEHYLDSPHLVSFKGKIFHFLGEVEAVFGIWCIPLLFAMNYYYDWDTVLRYIDRGVHYTEPMFIVVVMAISSTRPIIRFAESSLAWVAALGKSTPSAWWITILVIAPLLGSLITEPAAMTIGALLLAKKFYYYHPSNSLKYGTIGLLFVNVSVGGTLTHFAAPPVLMVASKWHWDTTFMIVHFGWKAVLGIVLATLAYWLIFHKELTQLNRMVTRQDEGNPHGVLSYWADRNVSIPPWITLIHLFFLFWTVMTLHHPALFLGGFLFFLAFVESTMTHQNPIQLRAPLLVGFFLAGLMTFGSLQQWWLEPVLHHLSELPSFIGAVVLTSFNDNAAITFLASQSPSLDTQYALDIAYAERMRYLIVSGAITGGGLTVIANAPNPAGQSILSRYFDNGVSPLWLLAGAILPTVIIGLCFLWFH